MKRRQFLQRSAAAAFAAPAVAAPAIAQSAPEIKWRLTSSFSKSLETLYGGAQMLSRYIAEATDNRFQMQAAPAGELAQSHQALDAVSSGAVDCAHTPLYFYLGKDVTLATASGLPFGLNTRHQQAWWNFGGGADIVNGALRKLNVKGLQAGSTGAQMGAWSKKEINSLDDVRGLRFRISGMGAPIIARLGAVPNQIMHADVYGALENGTIDGAEFISPHDDERLGIVKVAKYNYYPCWWESGGMIHLVVNLERWNALPKHYQAVVARACDAVTTWMTSRYDTVNPPALKRLVSYGAILKPFPPAVMDGFYKATLEHLAELSIKDPSFKRALESINAFRKDQYAWWQVSEHAMDGFMINQRNRA